jgi:gliding motility associated protien GldN
MKRLIFCLTGFTLVLCLAPLFTQAQVLEAPRAWSTENQLAGNKTQTYISARKAIPYQHVREADVIYSTRIWRYIDTREKINHPFIFPKSNTRDRISFNNLILNLGKGVGDQIQLYSDEDFQEPIDPAQVIRSIARQYQLTKTDEFGNPLPPVDTVEYLSGEDIARYYIIEDWFFDKQRSVMDVRIIAIAPVAFDFTVNPQGVKEFRDGIIFPFFIYFPDLRPILAKNLAFNLQNTSARMSWDDLFLKRQFGSVIIKEENVYDRLVGQYKQGLDALLEAEAIKERLFNYEQDLWEF